MKPWKPGDPVGRGAVYLPTRAASQAYTEACLHEMSDATARAIAKEPSIEKRRVMAAKAMAGQDEKYAIWLRSRVGEIQAQLKAERDAGLR